MKRVEAFKKALKYLKNTVQENLGGDLKVEILEANHCEIELM